MSRLSKWRAFPTWREHWTSLDGVPELLNATDAVLQRRMRGNQRLPQWDTPADADRLALGIAALRAWANGEPPKQVDKHPEIIRQIHAAVSSTLHATMWPRWLFLERAFFDASETGDLLFAALVLRTMCEEVQRLHALDLNVNELAELAGSRDAGKHDRLKLFLSVAWTSLDELPSVMVYEGTGWPKLKLIADSMPALESARGALNSYVHPNYGSHITALFPERASGARLLLDAVLVLYEAFFALSWAEQPIAGRSRPSGIGPLQSWTRSVRQLRSHTLPELRRTAANSALVEILKAPALTEWLTAKRDDLADMLRDPDMAPLLGDLPRVPSGGGASGEASNYRMWDGARAIDVLHLSSARRAEQLLVGEFPSGAPDPSDQVRWLKFNAMSLQLAMLIDGVKAAAFKAQLVRQVAQGNCLGAWLCVRSLIEHRALAVWLPNQIGSALDALAADLEATAPLPEIASEVSQPLANFLAGQAKKSKEDHRAWVMEEQGGLRTAWLNLKNIVGAAFSQEDRFHALYALSSAVLHGRYARGCDLMIDAAQTRSQANCLGLLILERLCSRDEEMDHLSTALTHWVRLEHAADFGGTLAASSDVMAKQAFGNVAGTLRLGIDYSGLGTADSPFCIEEHLQFHHASYALLRQIGVDPAQSSRILDYDSAGRLCDHWSSSGREYWFRLRL